VQDERGALLLGQPIDAPLEGPQPFAPADVFVGQHAVDLRRLVVEGPVGRGATLRGAARHEHDVDRHPVQPGRELGIAAKVAQRSVNLQKHLLHHVFDVGPRPEHAVHEANDVGAVAQEQLAKRLAIAGAAARQQIVALGRAHAATPPPPGDPARAGERPQQDQRARRRQMHDSGWLRRACATFMEIRPLPAGGNDDTSRRARRRVEVYQGLERLRTPTSRRSETTRLSRATAAQTSNMAHARCLSG
jgi:hypothetical protein